MQRFEIQFMMIAYCIFTGDITSFEDFDQFVSKEQGHGYFCTICQLYRRRGIADVRNHIESKHFPNTFSYSCNLCDIVLGTNTALVRHKQSKHKQE